ncbi:acyl-CoA N-acyltransferase [Neocallimastix lanati (nom. inval.)]|uniref:Acyl-CoA N-acyltransferase n=1 Tax=Neocallimastix californiae TaxID=1754190 RepID=A0A1Y2AXA7_9FUNG|nr:acyl-CoA N-acyltransferase [Neocallimastix sp. JGI-2020a]ORY27223.1 acyl-CoA N-acyltransferase [Neocallimastix californiae]|eukprot:ORY27223.1 acyl-CoA N-acyltransferase [Neocallimastix californiae]
MKLRKYESSDSKLICSWIVDEKSLYRWSADRIGKFPLNGNELNEAYTQASSHGEIVPLVAIDEENKVIGSFLIRYPNKNDKKTVRFGFVIVAPSLRGHGYGKKMLQLAIAYARDTLKASRITLSVFLDNNSALHCYESVGFKPIGNTEIFKFKEEDWKCTEMDITL